VAGIAQRTAAALSTLGFKITEVGNARQLPAGSASQILYGSSGYAAAQSLRGTLSGPVTEVEHSGLPGNQVSLLIASSALTVLSASSSATTSTTTTALATTSPSPAPSDPTSSGHSRPTKLAASDTSAHGASSGDPALPIVLIVVVIALLAGLAWFRWRRRPAEE
jgi:hypothetical protein